MNEWESSNPYVGLRPFRREDSLCFFGRREQTVELLDLLYRSRFLAVVGSSGCGKSSLTRAGLIPALLGGFLIEERNRWRIAVMSPGDAPLTNLTVALADALDDDAGAFLEEIANNHSQGMVDHVASRLGDDTNLLLLIDQFEEIFAFHGFDGIGLQRPAEQSNERRRELLRRRAEATDFVTLVLDLAKSRELSSYTVLTMRTDFLGDCDLFYGLPEAMNRGRYLVPRLNREQLRQAIEGPALLSGARIAPRLLDHLLNEIGDRADRLPVLQHALLRTWEVWQTDGEDAIDLEHYRAAGTLENALSNHAEEALRECDPEASARIFKCLTDTDASQRRLRRPAAMSELIAATSLHRPEVEDILARFYTAGRNFVYLSPGAEPDDPRVDISHESLIRQWKRLRDWVDEERESRDRFLELVRGARREAAGKTALLRNPDLQIVSDWQIATKPTAAWAERYNFRKDDFAAAMSYLDRSRKLFGAKALRRKKRNRILVALVAVTVLVALSGLALLAFNEKNVAEKQKAIAEEQRILADESRKRVASIALWGGDWEDIREVVKEEDLFIRAASLACFLNGHPTINSCFSNIRGNFDGAGMTLSMYLSFKTGTLPPFLLELEKQNPGILRDSFREQSGFSLVEEVPFRQTSHEEVSSSEAHYQEFMKILDEQIFRQIAWANSISTGRGGHTLKEPWLSYFRNLASRPEFLKALAGMLREKFFVHRALKYSERYGVRSERGIALMYYLCTLQGSPLKADDEIRARKARDGKPGEKELIEIIATERAKKAHPQWVRYLLSRYMIIVRGSGELEGLVIDLERDYNIRLIEWQGWH
jgi:hypothetical protein